MRHPARRKRAPRPRVGRVRDLARRLVRTWPAPVQVAEGFAPDGRMGMVFRASVEQARWRAHAARLRGSGPRRARDYAFYALALTEYCGRSLRAAIAALAAAGIPVRPITPTSARQRRAR